VQIGPQYAELQSALGRLATAQAHDLATASVPETLAALQVYPDIGPTWAEAGPRHKEHGYNVVPEKKKRPVLKFLGKLWGVSPKMR
jgi:H+-transporting ATPase